MAFDSISNIIIERNKNGKFKSVYDFLNRVHPKDINKLQLEGLTKAGAFDSIINNRALVDLVLPSENGLGYSIHKR